MKHNWNALLTTSPLTILALLACSQAHAGNSTQNQIVLDQCALELDFSPPGSGVQFNDEELAKLQKCMSSKGVRFKRINPEARMPSSVQSERS